MATELTVWLQAVRIGKLYLTQGRLTFQYTEDALASASTPALSVSLPKRVEPFNDHEARPYFAGLLPEGRLRNLIGTKVQVSRQNEFGLLREIGGECAGAVSITVGEAQPSNRDGHITQWLTQDELARVLDELPHRPMMAGVDGLRLSLAGAQDKLPVVFDGQRVGLPLYGSPSTHILKPAIAGVPGSVVNEAFCMRLAKAMKLPVAEVAILSTDRHEVLLVKRYDRMLRDGAVARLHQEDFCQALGVVSELKYQNEGGPGLSDAFGLLRAATRPSVVNILTLLDYTIFNALIGNHDAHGKNFSLLYRQPGSPSIAPLYDALSTTIYPDLTPKMAMKIGGKYRFSEVMDRHWNRFADETGLAKAQVRKRVVEIARQLPDVARKLALESDEFKGSKEVGQILEVIDQRSTLTQRRLTAA